MTVLLTVLFYKKMYDRFARRAKRSCRDNEVTVRRDFTVTICLHSFISGSRYEHQIIFHWFLSLRGRHSKPSVLTDGLNKWSRRYVGRLQCRLWFPGITCEQVLSSQHKSFLTWTGLRKRRYPNARELLASLLARHKVETCLAVKGTRGKDGSPC